jgi:hypothetical protein
VSIHGDRGYAYCIQGVDGGPIKIGFTVYSAETRRQTFQSGSPVELTVIACAPAPRPFEADIHAKLAARRLHGEWFEDCVDVQNVVGFIRALAETKVAA